MTLPGPVPQPNDRLEQRIKALEDLIAEMNRKTLHSASISGGGLTVRDGGAVAVETADGVQVFYIGAQTRNGVEYQGFTLRRPDGSNMFFTAPPQSDPNVIYWAWLDQTASVLVSEDSVAGQGLARPTLSIPVQTQRWDSLPSTDQGSFEAVQTTNYQWKQHPYWFVQIRHCSTAADTTGELRLTLDGTPVGSPISVGFAAAWVNIGPIAIPGTHMSAHILNLECRRTAGTGRIGASMVVGGQQS